MHKTKHNVKKALLILFFYLCFISSCSALDYNLQNNFTKDCLKENKQYQVKAVLDGDTILIISRDKKEKIRLLGIDAFEYDQFPYGKTGKDFLTMLVLNKQVCIETDIQEKDIYKRTLGYVFLSPKLFANEELLRNGLAILYDFPPNIKYIDRLKKAQVYGRQNMLGVWEKHDFILETPSQYRHKHPFKRNSFVLF